VTILSHSEALVSVQKRHNPLDLRILRKFRRQTPGIRRQIVPLRAGFEEPVFISGICVTVLWQQMPHLKRSGHL